VTAICKINQQKKQTIRNQRISICTDSNRVNTSMHASTHNNEHSFRNHVQFIKAHSTCAPLHCIHHNITNTVQLLTCMLLPVIVMYKCFPQNMQRQQLLQMLKVCSVYHDYGILQQVILHVVEYCTALQEYNNTEKVAFNSIENTQ